MTVLADVAPFGPPSSTGTCTVPAESSTTAFLAYRPGVACRLLLPTTSTCVVAWAMIPFVAPDNVSTKNDLPFRLQLFTVTATFLLT